MGPCSTHVVQPVLRSRSVLMQAVQSSGSRGETQVSGGGVIRAQNNEICMVGQVSVILIGQIHG